jgi:WD40 repeat protein
VAVLPTTPYRGIDSFRYVDHAIFFARADEAQQLLSLIAVYRGAMLYGDSGTGKSSLVNAGLLPAVEGLGFRPERVRVQPRDGEELVVERIATSDDDATALLPSLFSDDGDSRVVLSVSAFEQRLREGAASSRPLLVFDQFEEILTLFEGPGHETSQRRIAELLGALLRQTLPVKLLLVFREDYLGKVKELLASSPELVDQGLRLAPPSAEELPTIIRGPFERYPGDFGRELSPALAMRLCDELADRFGSGDVSLSEVQTVCLRLWQAEDPEALLAERGIQGLLEDYLGEALEAFPGGLKAPAIALLGQLITSAGTRNVISAEDLEQRVREEEDIPVAELEQALELLESESKLVRRERRRDLYLYEITSEFLVPWISSRREELRRQQERRRERRRLLVLAAIAAALLVVAAVVAGLAAWAFVQRGDARRQTASARALALDLAAGTQLASHPETALSTSLAAYRAKQTAATTSSMIAALEAVRRLGAVRFLHGHSGAVDGVALSPDGHTLASAGADSTIRLWDLRTGKELAQPLLGHLGPVDDIAFDPRGRTFASAGDDGSIWIWDAHRLTRQCQLLGDKARLPVHGPIYGVAFSPDGDTLASAGDDGTVRLWDLRHCIKLGAPLLRSGDPVRSVAFSADGQTLAAAGQDGKIRLWNVRSHTALDPPLDARAGPVYSVAFSPDRLMLASAENDGTVRLWNLRTHAQVGPPLRGHRGFVYTVSFSPDGRTLASGGDDWTVRLWDVGRHRQIRKLAGHPGAVFGVAFARDGRMLVSAGDDGAIRLWDLRSRVTLGRPFHPNAGLIYRIAFSPDGRLIASAGDDGRIRLWDVRSGDQLGRALGGRAGTVHDVAFTSDGRTLASAGYDKTIRLWDVRSHAEIGAPLRGHTGKVESVAFSPDGHMLASAGDDKTIRFWDVRSHSQLGRPLDGHAVIKSVAFSPDGRMLASAGADDTVRLWDVRARRELLPVLNGHGGGVNSVAFSPDGRTLASAGDDKTIRLWDVGKHTQLRKLTGHSDAVAGVAFSPDGRLLVSGGGDRTLRLWDKRSQAELGPPLQADSEKIVATVAFSPDGRTFASAGLDGTIRVWEGILWKSYDELQARVCRLVGAGLDPAEWEKLVPDLPYRQSCP